MPSRNPPPARKSRAPRSRAHHAGGRPRKLIHPRLATGGSLLAKLRAQAASLEDALRQTSKRGASARDVAALNAQLRGTYRDLGRITGEGELSEATILKSPALAAVIRAIIEALAPFPEALAAARDAVGKLAGVSDAAE